MIEDLLQRYIAWLEIRRDVAEICRDDAAWWDAVEAGMDARKALGMVKEGNW